MKRMSLAVFVAVALFVVASPLHAQGGDVDGCTDSPESPTVVLGLVGATGAGLAQLIRSIKSGSNK